MIITTGKWTWCAHTVPLKYEPVEVFLPQIDQSQVDKSTETWLDGIEDRLTYRHWYAGHYHTEKEIDRLTLLFESIGNSKREVMVMEEKDIHNDVWLELWNPEWPHEFHLEKQCIIGTLVANDHTAYVRHVGSTSIEGMPAKPIIDILVCPDKDIPLEDCIPDLERIGYRNLGECGRPGRYFLSSGEEPGKTFYVHLCYEDNTVAQDQLLFQEIMRKDAELRAKYVYTKYLLECEFPDNRNMYREMKGLFIAGVLGGYRLALKDKESEQE